MSASKLSSEETLSQGAVDLLFSSLNAHGKYLRSVVGTGCAKGLRRYRA